MAKLRIVKVGDEILRKKCRPVEEITPKTIRLLDDMAETMYAAEGVGLAAPQVGILRRFCVVDVGDGLIELVNPVIVKKEGYQIGDEGCLSLPGEYGKVKRPYSVTVRAQDRNGNNIEINLLVF